MKIVTQEEYERLYTQRSPVLNRLPNDPRRPPKFLAMYDFSKQGIEQMIFERTNPENGSLYFARQAVKQYVAAWKHYSAGQVRKPGKPIGLWAENLARSRAKVRVLEKELRELNRLLSLAVAAEAADIKERTKPLGVGKMKDGVLASLDGRKVIQTVDGKFAFEDTGEDVHEYLTSLNKVKREKAMARKQADRERYRRVLEAKGFQKKSGSRSVSI